MSSPIPQKKRFDPAVEFAKIREQYLSQASNNTFNALVLGRLGTGKTSSLATLPKPLLIHSFDPGGSKSLKKYIDDPNSGIYVESFENEDSKKPTEYARWERRFLQLKDDGAFDYFASYAVDSATTFTAAALNEVLRAAGRAGTIPQIQDYQRMMSMMGHFVHMVNSMAVNFVMLGHLTLEKDEITGKITAVPLIVGKQKETLPTLFDEVYISVAKPTAQGNEYKFLTQHESYYEARSRLASNGKLDKHEPQNFKEILKKTGYPYEDKKQQP